jgi:CheY-like chemotaxis protein
VYVKETSPGKGTTMEVIFPVHGDQLTGFKKESKTEKQLPDPAIRILWVDDDPGINKLVVELFKFLGYQGDTVNNAKSALELLERKTYDLVITDIGMPEMNGWQLADIIRDRFNGNMTVAVISGWDQPPDKQVTAEHGVSY